MRLCAVASCGWLRACSGGVRLKAACTDDVRAVAVSGGGERVAEVSGGCGERLCGRGGGFQIK